MHRHFSLYVCTFVHNLQKPPELQNCKIWVGRSEACSYAQKSPLPLAKSSSILADKVCWIIATQFNFTIWNPVTIKIQSHNRWLYLLFPRLSTCMYWAIKLDMSEPCKDANITTLLWFIQTKMSVNLVLVSLRSGDTYVLSSIVKERKYLRHLKKSLQKQFIKVHLMDICLYIYLGMIFYWISKFVMTQQASFSNRFYAPFPYMPIQNDQVHSPGQSQSSELFAPSSHQFSYPGSCVHCHFGSAVLTRFHWRDGPGKFPDKTVKHVSLPLFYSLYTFSYVP